jgi:hypothetical protein
MQTCSAFPWEASIVAPFSTFCCVNVPFPFLPFHHPVPVLCGYTLLPEVSKQIPNNPAEFLFLNNYPLDFSDLLGNIHGGIEIADI